MAGVTVDSGMTPGQGEEGMIEDGAGPGIDAMTDRALSGLKTGSSVIGIGGGIEIILMTDGTVCRNGVEDPGGMAGDTVDSRMPALEREVSVIKDRTLPGIDGMTLGAVAWKTHLRMVRIRGGVEIRGMTAVAVGGQSGELVIAMAGITVDGGMTPGQGEEGMIEDGAGPGIDAMTDRALGGLKTGSSVIGIGGGIEIILMTDGTVCRNGVEDPGGMAGDTVDSRMPALEREVSVVEYGTLPGINGMTLGAVAWKTHLRMVRIRGGVEIRGMTAVAVGGQSGELVIAMAGVTVDSGMTPGQGEEGMIEDGAGPGIDAMTDRALSGLKTGSAVIGIGGGSEILLMTDGTVCRNGVEDPGGMAGDTVDTACPPWSGKFPWSNTAPSQALMV